MSAEKNVKAQEQFGQAINSGNLEQLRELVADRCVDHDPAPDQQQGPQGFIDFFSSLRQAFPDMHVEVDHMVTDADNVAFAYTLTGTHRGDFLGVAPTGRSIEVRGLQISRFENGKLVERWGSSDQLGILQQLGAAPQPG